MKRYLYHFVFYSGFYEGLFYKHTFAQNDFEVIVEVVTFFMEFEDDVVAKEYLDNILGENWTVEDFWQKMDLKFFNGSEAYTLRWIKEIDFDLDNIGKFI
jgi:hypothetical protein